MPFTVLQCVNKDIILYILTRYNHLIPTADINMGINFHNLFQNL